MNRSYYPVSQQEGPMDEQALDVLPTKHDGPKRRRAHKPKSKRGSHGSKHSLRAPRGYGDSDSEDGSTTKGESLVQPVSAQTDETIRLLAKAGRRHAKKHTWCASTIKARTVATGHLYHGLHYALYTTLFLLSLAAMIIFLCLYLTYDKSGTPSVFSARFVNIRWHVDGVMQWSHTEDLAAVCYALAFGIAAVCYASYSLFEGPQLWNFRVFALNGYLPAQVIDEVFANSAFVILLLCVAGQNDLFELIYGTSFYVMTKVLYSIAQGYGFDYHWWAPVSMPYTTFGLGVAGTGLFWASIMTSAHYASDAPNLGVWCALWFGLGIDLLMTLMSALATFYHNGVGTEEANEFLTQELQNYDPATQAALAHNFRVAFARLQPFPVDELIEYTKQGATGSFRPEKEDERQLVDLMEQFTRDKELASMYEHCASTQATHSKEGGRFIVTPEWTVLQADWARFSSRFMRFLHVRFVLSFLFKLAVALALTVGDGMRTNVQANDAK